MRADQYKEDCLSALPLFATAVRYSPTKEVAEWVKKIHQSIMNEIGDGGIKNKILSCIVPVLAFAEQIKIKHFAYPQAKLQRTEYRISDALKDSPGLAGDGLLTIKTRPRNIDHHPLVVDLQGVFNGITVTKAKKRIEDYLMENRGHLAINFKGITSFDQDALLIFLKKLTDYKERIKIISIDSLQAEMADVVTYARKYFEVFMDVDGLNKSLSVPG